MDRSAKRYYSSEKELQAVLRNLKQMPCPHCRLIGALNRHGFLTGYDECSEHETIIRGRRIFCNSRKRRNKGCGRTFCVLAATALKRFSISAHSLWRFLKGIVKQSDRLPSFRRLNITHHESAAYRLWKLFANNLTKIRTLLTKHCPRPKLPVAPCPATQTIAHLKSVFKEAVCPIAAFQQHFQVSFL